MKKKSLSALLLALSILSLSACRKVPEEDLMFFFFESCPSCDEYQLAESYGKMIDELDGRRRWKGISRNLITPESAKELKAVLKEKGLPDISRSLPLLIMRDEYINGYTAIGEKLDELLNSEN